jgi:hypothetical protein
MVHVHAGAGHVRGPNYMKLLDKVAILAALHDYGSDCWWLNAFVFMIE